MMLCRARLEELWHILELHRRGGETGLRGAKKLIEERRDCARGRFRGSSESSKS